MMISCASESYQLVFLPEYCYTAGQSGLLVELKSQEKLKNLPCLCPSMNKPEHICYWTDQSNDDWEWLINQPP
jgi:hypothetical protein